MPFPEEIKTALEAYEAKKKLHFKKYHEHVHTPAVTALKQLTDEHKDSAYKLLLCFLLNMPLNIEYEVGVYIAVLENASLPIPLDMNVYTSLHQHGLLNQNNYMDTLNIIKSSEKDVRRRHIIKMLADLNINTLSNIVDAWKHDDHHLLETSLKYIHENNRTIIEMQPTINMQKTFDFLLKIKPEERCYIPYCLKFLVGENIVTLKNIKAMKKWTRIEYLYFNQALIILKNHNMVIQGNLMAVSNAIWPITLVKFLVLLNNDYGKVVSYFMHEKLVEHDDPELAYKRLRDAFVSSRYSVAKIELLVHCQALRILKDRKKLDDNPFQALPNEILYRVLFFADRKNTREKKLDADIKKAIIEKNFMGDKNKKLSR